MIGKLERTLGRLRTGMSGLLGSRLPEELRSPSETQLGCHGRTVDPAELARVIREQPRARDLVFFVHGLMRDERCFHAEAFDMAAAFEDDFDVLAVDVRYDTSRHISDNGRDLAALLEALHLAIAGAQGRWHLVTHSMGGLVARSALYQAEQMGMAFTRRIDRVFLLGTPNRGARLEQGVQLAALGLELAVPVLRTVARGVRVVLTSARLGPVVPLGGVAAVTDVSVNVVPTFFVRLAGRVLDLRSDGIRDLRHGTMLREEWEQRPAWGGLLPRRRALPPLPWVRTYAVAGSLSRRVRGDRAIRATDGLVSAASAANSGNDELGLVESGRFRLLAGVGHLEMPRSREVYRTLCDWFAGDMPPGEVRPATPSGAPARRENRPRA